MDDLKSRFAPVPKRAWPPINPDEVTALLQQRHDELTKRQETERAEYAARQPRSTAPVRELVAWDNEAEVLAAKHQKEQDDFTCLSLDLPVQVRELNAMCMQYDHQYNEYVRALTTAWQNAKPVLEVLRDKEAKTQERWDELLKLRGSILEKLALFGGETLLVGNRFGDVETPIHDYYLGPALEEWELNGVKRPEPPPRPLEPRPIDLGDTPREVTDSLAPVDIVLLLAGLALGASISAAIGAIGFTSDGWHATPMAWIMLVLGIVTTVMLGKVVFPRIAQAKYIDIIDPYPYLPDDDARVTARKKAERSSRLATVGLAAIILVLAVTDYYGWWRAANEQNLARVGEEDLFILNPWVAGAAMVAFTTLLMLGKWSAVSGKAIRIRNGLLDRIEQIKAEYRGQRRWYEEKDAEYQEALTAVEEYDRKFKEADANAGYWTRKRIEEIAPSIQRYHQGLTELYGSVRSSASPSGHPDYGYPTVLSGAAAADPVEAVREEIDRVVHKAVESAAHQKVSMMATADAIDQIHQEVYTLKNPTP